MHTWLKTCNLSNNHSFCYTVKINKTYISTSLKVVSIAKVFWESFSRVATRFRSLVIGTFDNNERHKKTFTLAKYNSGRPKISMTHPSFSFFGRKLGLSGRTQCGRGWFGLLFSRLSFNFGSFLLLANLLSWLRSCFLRCSLRWSNMSCVSRP